MIINFKCKDCGQVFDCDMGMIGINDQTFRPVFEKQIICPSCGEKGLDDVQLTELGESLMTEATMNV